MTAVVAQRAIPRASTRVILDGFKKSFANIDGKTAQIKNTESDILEYEKSTSI